MDPTGPLLFVTTAAASVALTYLPKRNREGEGASESGVSTGRGGMVLSELQQISPLHKANTVDLLVVTRIHGTGAHKMATPEAVEKFVASVHQYATKILICIGNVGAIPWYKTIHCQHMK